MIQINNLSYSYGNMKILENLNLTIPKNKITSILGPSGCGKSTLIREILQQNNPSIKYFETQKIIGYMPQNDALLNWMDVESNILLPSKLTKKDSKVNSVLLKEFDLYEQRKQLVSTLSGGQKSKVSFLRAMVSCDNLLVCDEPFSKLDYITRYQTHHWFLDNLAKHRKTVLFITHDVDEAIFLSDIIVVLSCKPAGVKKIFEKPWTAEIKSEIFRELKN